MVEAIETLFEPVVIYNNQPGKDATVLKRFKEPAWNYQVIRFLNSEAKDIIPRRDKISTTSALASRMVSALIRQKKTVPQYLRALAGKSAANDVGKAAFAMHCFWTGEARLGALPGVLTTEAGWFKGQEVTLVEFDRSVIDFSSLVKKAVSLDCAYRIYTTNETDLKTASRNSRLTVGRLTETYRPAPTTDQKRQLRGTRLAQLPMSPMQATKVNALARTKPLEARNWLSPRQLQQMGN